jgi:hypothetical protein
LTGFFSSSAALDLTSPLDTRPDFFLTDFSRHFCRLSQVGPLAQLWTGLKRYPADPELRFCSAPYFTPFFADYFSPVSPIRSHAPLWNFGKRFAGFAFLPS